MVKFTTLVAGLTLAVSVFGSIAVPEDDEFAHLAASSNSYAEWADKISAEVEAQAGNSTDISSRDVADDDILVDDDDDFDTEPDFVTRSRLFKRTCHSQRNGGVHKPASTADAARCVSALARRGKKRCTAGVSATRFISHGVAEIVGVGGCAKKCESRHATCHRIAVAAGHIMDHCSHNGITGGERLIKKKHLNVILAGL